jgi:alpha-beta hydrolase superfamily lysophospholipase
MADLATFTDTDGVEVSYRAWRPDGDNRAFLLVAHGASEHSGRYERFARHLTEHGYAVYAGDHRGHGATAAVTGVGRAGPRGWEGMVDDLGVLSEIARSESGDVPFILFGHSMGSFLAQLFAQRHNDVLDGLVLSGSAGDITGLADTIGFLETVVADGGGDQPAPLFDAFNAAFEPARTPFDWLSRDDGEVDRYIADPMCGNDAPLTIDFVLDMLRHAAEAWEPDNERLLPKDLPVLLITGERDPVSEGGRTVRDLEARYRALGLADVTALYYPDARHELLNETNRDQVQADVVAWLDRITER